MAIAIARVAAVRGGSGIASSSKSAGVARRAVSSSSRQASWRSMFGWFGRKDEGSNGVPSEKAESTTTASNPSTTTIAPTTAHSKTSAPSTSTSSTSPHTTSSSSSSPNLTQPSDKIPQPKVQSKMLARDQELLSKLLEREGGSAGVSIVNGRYEEGLGPETKKNMFRLI
ncbi:60S ribosomal protein [Pseudozyma hubeiensis]|nr:60S ribosomal protein [Pseudozyma hubeiensis]